jgi:dUTP pyrophosphatase
MIDKFVLPTNINENLHLQEITTTELVAKVTKLSESAVIPNKTNLNDVGFDLTLIDLKKINEVGVEFYGTGLKIEPPKGYYFEIVPRSSITKTGYILANSLGVIDPDYRGELLVPLTKLNCLGNSNLTIDLPARLCQLILRKHPSCVFLEKEKLSDTIRGEGGFGSTG